MDFPNAQLPVLTPLRHSFAVDDIEDQLRNLFIDLFDTFLAIDAFDANVLGMAHLGTLNLVKRMVNTDGLVLLPGTREEPATRYVYRAWKATNVQGRGLHFLRTYLQALYPGIWNIEQQMQDSALTYPMALYDRTTHGNDADKYLTSRLSIKLAVTGGIDNVSEMIPVISAIIPARFIPKLSLVLYSESEMLITAVGSMTMSLSSAGAVTAPVLSYPDSGSVVAGQANIVINLTSSGNVW